MKFLEVSDKDMKCFAQLINMLHAGEFKLNGKDMCASADTIRWLQDVAKGAAECYSKPRASSPVQPEPIAEAKKEEPPTGGLPSGVTLKAFSPGKPSKSKK